jgi:hypothetical protein
MRYQFIDEQEKAWPVTPLCGVLNVSQSGYYDWTARGQSPHVSSNHHLERRIRDNDRQSTQ